MALINSIVGQGLVDQAYVDNYTKGFEDLKERARHRTPEWAEAIYRRDRGGHSQALGFESRSLVPGAMELYSS